MATWVADGVRRWAVEVVGIPAEVTLSIPFNGAQLLSYSAHELEEDLLDAGLPASCVAALIAAWEARRWTASSPTLETGAAGPGQVRGACMYALLRGDVCGFLIATAVSSVDAAPGGWVALVVSVSVMHNINPLDCD